jgi:hypothetical protein
MKITHVFIFVLLLTALFADVRAQSTFIDKGQNAAGVSVGYGYFEPHNSSVKLSGVFGSFGISRAGLLEAGAGAAMVGNENDNKFITALNLGLYPVNLYAGPFTFMPGIGGAYQIDDDEAVWSVTGGMAINIRMTKGFSFQYGAMVGKYSSIDREEIKGTLRGGYFSLVFKTSRTTTYLITANLQSDENTTGFNVNFSLITGTSINGEYK